MTLTDSANASAARLPMPHLAASGGVSQQPFQPVTAPDAGPMVLQGTILPSLLDETLLELELSLTNFDASRDFASVVRDAARALSGDFLFALPASGLLPRCTDIAAVRLFSNGDWITVFACLEPDGETIRIEQADDSTARLHAFAGAFVHFLERF